MLSFEVMADVFAIRNELGRFFNERIYKRALAIRRRDVQLEFPVDVVHQDFTKRYFLDVLAANGGVFEFKVAEKLTPRHRAQLLHYLFLVGLRHGLIVNLRPEEVEREFVNAAMTQDERHNFGVEQSNWDASLPGATDLKDILLSILGDWGSGLELQLYEEALTHFLGGESRVMRRMSVTFQGSPVGEQLMRLAGEAVAFKLTAFESESDALHFDRHAQRLLAHTDLRALLWINIARRQIKFTTVRADRE